MITAMRLAMADHKDPDVIAVVDLLREEARAPARPPAAEPKPIPLERVKAAAAALGFEFELPE